MADSGVPLLRLVRADEPPSPSSRPTVLGVQEVLFPDPSTVLLVAVDDARGENLPKMLQNLRPQAVLDVRTFPRFDFGKLDRKRFFSVVEQLAIEYFDAGLEPVQRPPSSDFLADAIRRQLASLSTGPVMVLVDARSDREDAVASLAESLRKEEARWTPSLRCG